jgi:acyl-CoA thioester hydrolase
MDGITKPFEVNLDFHIRTYDIDYAGVVSNLVYLRWFEDLRLTVLDVHYPFERLLDAGLAPTVTETLIQYKRPAGIKDRASGRMWVAKLSKIKVVFQGEIYINGELAVTAQQKGCLIDMKNGRIAPIPEDLLNLYQDQSRKLSNLIEKV